VAGERRRRLAAILAADVVGSARLMAEDEATALAAIARLRRDVLEPAFAAHGGRLFKAMGKGPLAEFPSAVEALRCALAEQAALPAGDLRLGVRIGVHAGDVAVAEDGPDLLGDGEDVAARLLALAEPGGTCLSALGREDAAGRLSLGAAIGLSERQTPPAPVPSARLPPRPGDRRDEVRAPALKSRPRASRPARPSPEEAAHRPVARAAPA
jgi:class 3 adenylate cyclase